MMFLHKQRKLNNSSIIAIALLAIMSAALPRMVVEAQSCKTVTTVENFNLDVYASKPWYIHEQAVTTYSPPDRFYCVRAKYTVRNSPSIFWRYSVGVDNYAQDAAGNEYGGPLCAYATGQSDSKLAVAPCFLPRILAGPYWIVAYNEDEGYALISGGQPTRPSTTTASGQVLCKTGQGVNGSGLWIFTRSPVRNETLVTMVRDMAEDAGFDTSVLLPVNHTVACNYPS